jgi:hypothetical protein
LFRLITDSLDRLRNAGRADNAQDFYLQLRTLDAAVSDLARNARDFHATIARTSREDRLEEHVFLMYKEELISYLQTFHDDLVRNRVSIVRQLTDLDRVHRDRLLNLATANDDRSACSAIRRTGNGVGTACAPVVVDPPTSGIEQLTAATTCHP